MAKSKYKNKKRNGFDSKKEENRYKVLLLMEQAGEITNLRKQVKFELIPSQYINGKCVERSVTYIADFVYQQDGETVVEDVKSKWTKTPQYVIKRKLMLYNKHIKVKEII